MDNENQRITNGLLVKLSKLTMDNKNGKREKDNKNNRRRHT
jgi:hypothetical protein